MNKFKFNLIYHFLVLIESPINFVLSIFGSVKFLTLGEWYIMRTEYKRIVEEYQSSLDNKVKQFNQSIDLFKQAKYEDE